MPEKRTDEQLTPASVSALNGAYIGFINIRSLAEYSLHELRNGRAKKYAGPVERKLEAIWGIADSLHNIPALIADRKDYSVEFVQKGIEEAEAHWKDGNAEGGEGPCRLNDTATHALIDENPHRRPNDTAANGVANALLVLAGVAIGLAIAAAGHIYAYPVRPSFSAVPSISSFAPAPHKPVSPAE